MIASNLNDSFKEEDSEQASMLSVVMLDLLCGVSKAAKPEPSVTLWNLFSNNIIRG